MCFELTTQIAVLLYETVNEHPLVSILSFHFSKLCGGVELGAEDALEVVLQGSHLAGFLIQLGLGNFQLHGCCLGSFF